MKSLMKFGCLATVMAMSLTGVAHGQVIGSYDNFDVFNDTGVEAEGFEIDIEDVSPGDLTREFPSNFGGTLWVNRYGLPTVTAYDWTSNTPDAAHAYDAGHKGVLVTWAATNQGGAWVATYGGSQSGLGTAGNGTPFNPKPTLTAGDSCWWWGLGAAYPSSGCDHFGVSFAAGVAPGKMTYHWQIPDASNTVLVNARLEASIPASPVLAVAPPVPNAPPAVVAVAHAPADAGGDPMVPQAAEPQFGDAYWLKVTTTYSPVRAVLENLQLHVLKQAKGTRTIAWKLLQRPPGVGAKAGAPERMDDENDKFPNVKAVQVTKQYQYFKFAGAYDSETHEALCDSFYGSSAAALAAGTTVQISCQNKAGNDAPYTRTYWTIDPGPGTAVQVKGGNLGTYLGAHINAYNVN